MSRRCYLLAYDIRDPRRLGRIFRYCKRRGLHVQYSIFLLRLTEHELRRVEADLKRLIDRRMDDVRIYPVPSSPQWVQLGRSPLPESVFLFSEDEAVLAAAATESARIVSRRRS